MNPRIITLEPKQLIGQSLEMSLINNTTGQLWGQFAPRIKEIQNRASEDKISLQVYPADYPQNFKPTNTFIKWAAVEVTALDHIPEGMKSFHIEGGLYAVFDYKGSSADPSIFQYIFSQWIPSSSYWVDDRPHFEVLGTEYKNNDPESEEEIWVPIRTK
jgi:AraC family transcriptional regulator